MQPELDESFAVDVLGEWTRSQLVAYRVSQRCAPPGPALPLFRTHDLGATSVEMKMQRAPLVVAQCLVIELAQNVSRHITHDQADDLLVDAVLAPVERVPNRFVERRGRQP